MREEMNRIVQWLRECVHEAKANGLVVGVSGGLDSAVIAHLINEAFPNDSMGVIMPIYTRSTDYEDAKSVIQTSGVEELDIDLSSIKDSLFDLIKNSIPENEWQSDHAQLADANLRARLRMSTLYTVATNYNYLVVGTDNLSEWYTGYFTKYGDGGVDLLPIVGYTKSEVYEMARILKIPASIIEKKPSADLWEDQTDEKEMGTTYTAIDAYVSGKEVDKADAEKIKAMHERTEHKRNIPKMFIR